MILMIEGVRRYENIYSYMMDFIERLTKKIERLFEAGKKLGEISNKVNSKSSALYTLSCLEGAIILWALNPNINLEMVFQDNFKHVWNSLTENDR